jgi:hypothetical protein
MGTCWSGGWWEPIGEQVADGGGSECRNRLWRGRYTECPRRNVKNFGRVFLMLKYTDITQNTYIQS